MRGPMDAGQCAWRPQEERQLPLVVRGEKAIGFATLLSLFLLIFSKNLNTVPSALCLDASAHVLFLKIVCVCL